MSTAWPPPNSAGALPEPIEVAKEAFQDLSDNFVAYLVAGIGMIVANIVSAIAAMPAFIAIAAVGFFLGDTLDELVIVAMAPFYLLAMLIIVVAQSAFGASLSRAARDHIRGTEPLSFNAAFRTATSGLGKASLYYIAMGFSVTLGMLLCCLPGLGALVVFAFATPLVFAADKPIGTALSEAFEFVKANLAYTLVIAVIGTLTVIAGSMIPLLSIITAPVLSVWVNVLMIRALRPAFPELR